MHAFDLLNDNMFFCRVMWNIIWNKLHGRLSHAILFFFDSWFNKRKYVDMKYFWNCTFYFQLKIIFLFRFSLKRIILKFIKHLESHISIRNPCKELPCKVYKFIYPTQPAITCSNLTIETLEQRCETCSNLTIKPPKRRQWRCFGGFIVKFEPISHLCSSVSIVNFEQVNAGWVVA